MNLDETTRKGYKIKILEELVKEAYNQGRLDYILENKKDFNESIIKQHLDRYAIVMSSDSDSQ